MARKVKNVRRVAHAVDVASRSAHASNLIKCYVAPFEHPNGLRDLELREKSTCRKVRVLTRQPMMHRLAPLSNLLQDCRAHGGGLVQPRGREEFIAIHAPIVSQNTEEVVVSFDDSFVVKVNLVTTDIAFPPISVWCYIEEYPVEGNGLGVRLRQKSTGRKVEMYGKNKHHLAQFLSSPRIANAQEFMPNLYEKDGYEDYVLVSGGTAVDSYDVIRFKDGADLAYLLGPTPDTAYRDAFRVLDDEAAAAAHFRTAESHLEAGRYREAILSARLAVEVACGGVGADVRRQLEGAPSGVEVAGKVLQTKRGLAVHEGETRVEQQDAEEAINAMKQLFAYLVPDRKQL